MDPIESEVMRHLATYPGLVEVRRVLTFHCYRKAADGSMQEVTVEIHDRGPGKLSRYSGTARTKDGREAHSNEYDDVDMAIAGIHWNELDASDS